MRRSLLVCLGLVVATAAVYGQTLGFDFVMFDDDGYVTENPWLREGIGADTLRWAWTSGYMSNWHPLTWVSYLLDFEIYGLRAAGYHATNLLLHTLNALLVFGWLRCATRRQWPSALVAALFALHPLHVESVAWVSERKDLLSGFFGLLSLCAYLQYARRGGPARYALVATPLALGLMAKPMLVTFPFLFLLLDYWPLRRIRLPSPDGAPGRKSEAGCDPRSPRRLLLEKLPLLALSVAAMALALRAQQGMMAPGATVPVHLRLANAVYAYGWYLAKTVWPTGLSVHHPHPYLPWAGGTPLAWWHVTGAALALIVVSVAVARARRRPYLLVGWLWFVGSLVPVIGLVQVGTQGMAGRYTYLPLVGLFVAAAWGAADILERFDRATRVPRLVAAGLAGLLLLGCGALAWRETGYWRGSIALFRHSLQASPRDRILHVSLGMAYQAQGQPGRAIAHYESALLVDPDYPLAHFRKAVAHTQTGELDRAEEHYRHALRLTPDVAEVHTNLAGIHLLQERPKPAIEHYRHALRIRPRDPILHVNLGIALQADGRIEEAIASYRNALDLEPENIGALLSLANALGASGHLDEAIEHFERVLEVRPDHTGAQAGSALAQRLRLRGRDPG